MAKVEELNKSMGPAYKIADQVKDIKRLLDLFENALNTKWFNCMNNTVNLKEINQTETGRWKCKKNSPFEE